MRHSFPYLITWTTNFQFPNNWIWKIKFCFQIFFFVVASYKLNDLLFKELGLSCSRKEKVASVFWKYFLIKLQLNSGEFQNRVYLIACKTSYLTVLVWLLLSKHKKLWIIKFLFEIDAFQLLLQFLIAS